MTKLLKSKPIYMTAGDLKEKLNKIDDNTLLVITSVVISKAIGYYGVELRAETDFFAMEDKDEPTILYTNKVEENKE